LDFISVILLLSTCLFYNVIKLLQVKTTWFTRAFWRKFWLFFFHSRLSSVYRIYSCCGGSGNRWRHSQLFPQTCAIRNWSIWSTARSHRHIREKLR